MFSPKTYFSKIRPLGYMFFDRVLYFPVVFESESTLIVFYEKKSSPNDSSFSDVFFERVSSLKLSSRWSFNEALSNVGSLSEQSFSKREFGAIFILEKKRVLSKKVSFLGASIFP